jgi:mannose-6-phosphate isomerase
MEVSMSLLKLSPSCKSALWGGTKLIGRCRISFDGGPLAETWELSCHKSGESVIAGGLFKGVKLGAWIEAQGKQVLGKNCARFSQFPILVKLIDAREKLSVQVHPDDAYALENEGQYGKTELWYVVEAEAGAELTLGFIRHLSREELLSAIEHDRLCDYLQTHAVKAGDVFLIEPGTVHAIGAGIVIAEIQQSSDVTYRLYDYGRIGPDGALRPLHIDQALAVLRPEPAPVHPDFGGHLGLCPFFTVDRLDVNGRYRDFVSGDSFRHLLILDGSGVLSDGRESLFLEKGDSLFISAGTGDIMLLGRCTALMTSVPPA